MHRFITASRVWLALALLGFALGTASIILTNLLHLHPCYLCIFQRLMYLIIAAFAMTAALSKWRLLTTIFAVLVLLCTIAGIGVAGYQVWLQSLPGAEFMCAGGDPNAIELLVIWLSARIPVLFQATGNCASKELAIFGLSLAEWSLVGFISSLLAATLALWQFNTNSR